MTVEEKISAFSDEIRQMFGQVRDIVYSVAPKAEETVWAGLPSYYVGDKFVRVIPFKDHLNIEAVGLTNHKSGLKDCKFTPKNMLQIFAGQPIPTDILSAAFRESLC